MCVCGVVLKPETVLRGAFYGLLRLMYWTCTGFFWKKELFDRLDFGVQGSTLFCCERILTLFQSVGQGLSVLSKVQQAAGRTRVDLKVLIYYKVGQWRLTERWRRKGVYWLVVMSFPSRCQVQIGPATFKSGITHLHFNTELTDGPTLKENKLKALIARARSERLKIALK